MNNKLKVQKFSKDSRLLTSCFDSESKVEINNNGIKIYKLSRPKNPETYFQENDGAAETEKASLWKFGVWGFYLIENFKNPGAVAALKLKIQTKIFISYRKNQCKYLARSIVAEEKCRSRRPEAGLYRMVAFCPKLIIFLINK